MTESKCWICNSDEPTHIVAGDYCRKQKEGQDRAENWAGPLLCIASLILGVVFGVSVK